MPSIRVNFKTPEKATEFAKHFGVVGLKVKTETKGSSVTVISSDKKTHEFVKNIIDDLKGETKMESVMASFMLSIIGSAENDTVVEANLLDGSTVSIDPDFARCFMSIHDSLDGEEGQTMLRSVAVECEESFNKTREFVAEERK